VDAKLAYWTWALANLLAIVICAGIGVVRIRRGELRAHRRLMLTASALVGLFLASYVLKLQLLGREPLELWSAAQVTMLRIHELFVGLMLLGGALAGHRAWRMRASLRGASTLPAATERGRDRRFHRRAGRAAVVAAVFGFLTAGVVLYGMYERAL
jgi:uncharacterized membrane protein YozB (DUF420 family)